MLAVLSPVLPSNLVHGTLPTTFSHALDRPPPINALPHAPLWAAQIARARGINGVADLPSNGCGARVAGTYVRMIDGGSDAVVMGRV